MTCREESIGFVPIKIGGPVGEITLFILRLRVFGPTTGMLSIIVSTCFYIDGLPFWTVALHNVLATC